MLPSAVRPPRSLVAAALLATTLAAGAAAAPVPSPSPTVTPPAAGTAATATPSTAPVDLVYAEPVQVRRIWRELGERAGLRVVFDPDLPDATLAIDLRGATAPEAVALLSAAAGHFTKPLASGALLVAQDTPRERREHEELAVRQFALEHVGLPEAMTLLRGILDMRRLTPNPGGEAIVVRDTLPKVELAGRLLELYDRPAAEVEVDVDRLTVAASALAELAGGGSAVRVPAARLARLAGDDLRRLTTLSALSGRRASYEASGGPDAAGPGAADLELSVEPRVHGDTGEVSLDLAAQAIHRGESGGGIHKLTSSLRLDAGSAFLLVGLLPEGAAAPGRVPVLALTPRIVREAGLRPADLETVYAGSDLRSALGGAPPEAAEADAGP